MFDFCLSIFRETNAKALFQIFNSASPSVSHLLNHVGALAFIPLKVFVDVYGQNWNVAQILKLHPVDQRGDTVSGA